MGVNLVIAVTDKSWFETLRNQPNLSEVNFWAPRAKKGFKALQPGELFLFKLHSPHNFVVGGGIFAHASTLPCSLAWEAFGEANGALSAQEMRERIVYYHEANLDDRNDFSIGCRILTQPFFLDETEWISVPKNWSPSIQSLKVYNTDESEGLQLWKDVTERVRKKSIPVISEDLPRFGKPQVFDPRLGQGAFRILVRDNYNRRCAVTGERTLPALEAAHIKPYSKEGAHESGNGLLLRRDIHSLFDAGYVTVTPDLNFEVSPRIKEEFENGRHYYALQNQKINVPEEISKRPNPDALIWHNEQCFLR
jgi:putative restriction endonuclease